MTASEHDDRVLPPLELEPIEKTRIRAYAAGKWAGRLASVFLVVALGKQLNQISSSLTQAFLLASTIGFLMPNTKGYEDAFRLRNFHANPLTPRAAFIRASYVYGLGPITNGIKLIAALINGLKQAFTDEKKPPPEP